MNGQYVEVDVSGIQDFAKKMRQAAGRDLKQELAQFLDASGFEMLRIIEDEIIRLKVVDTRLLLNSFHKGAQGNVYELNEGDLTLKIGTNVEYAKFVNDGHRQTPGRFIPGTWDGNGKFRYQRGASTGIVLKADWVEGRHFLEHSVVIMEKMFPKLLERKMDQWLNGLFA